MGEKLQMEKQGLRRLIYRYLIGELKKKFRSHQEILGIWESGKTFSGLILENRF